MDITNKLLNVSLDHDEVISYLYSIAGTLSRRRNKLGQLIVQYPIVSAEIIIDVTYNKKNKIQKLTVTSGAEKNVSTFIESVCKCLGDKTDVSYITFLLYSPSLPIVGFHKNDALDYQIIPVPDRDPQPEYYMADHPFLVQTSYYRSCIQWVDISRKHHKKRTLELALTGSINGNFIPPSNLQKQGVITDRYRWELENKSNDKLLPSDGLNRIYLEKPNDHYNKKLSLGDDQTLPSDIDAQIDRIYRLTADDAERHLLACYWLKQSNITPSTSLSYLSLALALESLLPDIDSQNICPMCKTKTKTKYRISVGDQIKMFLIRHAKIPENEVSKYKGKLYDLRSSIAHGDHIFEEDEYMKESISGQDHEEKQYYQLLKRIVRVSLYNWLMDEERFPQLQIPTA